MGIALPNISACTSSRQLEIPVSLPYHLWDSANKYHQWGNKEGMVINFRILGCSEVCYCTQNPNGGRLHDVLLLDTLQNFHKPYLLSRPGVQLKF